MKSMKFFLTGALALSVLSPAITIAMEMPQQPQAATASNNEQAAICGICFDILNNGEDKRTLPCHPKHTFHRACINNWLISQQNTGHPAVCPMCKALAIPEFSKKERLIAHLKKIEAHNPFNQNNRKFTLKVAAGSYATSFVIFILILLKTKYFDKAELVPLKEIIKKFTTDHFAHLFYLGNFSVEYILAKYVFEPDIEGAFAHGLKLAFWIIGFILVEVETTRNN